MTTRLGLVLFGEVFLLAWPAFAQRSARAHPSNDGDDAVVRQADAGSPATAGRPARAGGAARASSDDRNERALHGGERGRSIYTRHGVIYTNEFDAASRASGWNHGQSSWRDGQGICGEVPGQGKKEGCPKALRGWLLRRLLKRKRLKQRPPVIFRDPARDRDEYRAN
jgi:hypothetical protein